MEELEQVHGRILLHRTAMTAPWMPAVGFWNSLNPLNSLNSLNPHLQFTARLK